TGRLAAGDGASVRRAIDLGSGLARTRGARCSGVEPVVTVARGRRPAQRAVGDRPTGPLLSGHRARAARAARHRSAAKTLGAEAADAFARRAAGRAARLEVRARASLTDVAGEAVRARGARRLAGAPAAQIGRAAD